MFFCSYKVKNLFLQSKTKTAVFGLTTGIQPHNPLIMETIPIERHPLEPFLPENARLLMLGSFPPQRKRWNIEFYYPNLQNDMWRIYGHLFFGDKNHFLLPGLKGFDKDKIVAFLLEQGIAIYDTSTAVRRLKDNASDKFLETVEPTDIGALLDRIPQCQAIVTTGQKATDTICEQLNTEAPPMGGRYPFTYRSRALHLYRMPSSSRAYPMALEKKAASYRTLFEDLGMLQREEHSTL